MEAKSDALAEAGGGGGEGGGECKAKIKVHVYCKIHAQKKSRQDNSVYNTWRNNVVEILTVCCCDDGDVLR